MAYRALLLSLAVAGCTQQNPDYLAGDMAGGENADLVGQPPQDLVGTPPPDLAKKPPPDLLGVPLFGNPVPVAAMNNWCPVGLAAASIDSKLNGTIDLAVSASCMSSGMAAGSVTLLLGDGKGAFATQPPIKTGTGSAAIVLGEFNGDGRADFAVANSQGGTVDVLIGGGDGKLNLQSTVSIGPGSTPRGLAAGDLTRDGRDDLVVGAQGYFRLYVAIGNGNGSFQAPAGGLSGNARGLAIGSINDGKDTLADVALGGFNTMNGASALFGDGTGKFPTSSVSSFPGETQAVAIGDVNGDKHADLVAATGMFNGSTFDVLLGDGNGGFKVSHAGLAQQGPTDLALADFDRDGDLDAALSLAGSATLLVLLNKGDGTFPTTLTFPLVSRPVSLEAADFNSDGKPDLAAAAGNSVYLLLNSW